MKRHTITLPSGDSFSPDKTFNCGQCFRFDEVQEGWQGIVGNDVVFFPKEQPSGKIEYFSHNGIDLSDFLDCDTSYSEVNQAILTAFDGDTASVIENAVELSSGLRILRQDFWEALCSFIISQNNNIPRIKKNVAAISARYGKRIENTDFYSFPSPEALIEAGVEGLNDCRLGFRTKYILHACHMLISGEIAENKLSFLSDTEAKQYLMKIHGVGPKVASCALLYGAHRLSEVPVDVWMKKVFNRYFGSDFADLGEYGGILQQYLFFRERFIIEGKKI
jgi:N-glycosylase/DNA lyase